MLVLNPSVLQVIDYVLFGAGIGLTLYLGVALLRSPARRDPLAGYELPERGPGLEGLLLALGAFFLVNVVIAQAAQALGLKDAFDDIGSDGWHRLHTARGIGELVTAGVIAVLLWKSGALRTRGVGLARGVLVAVTAVLVLTPTLLLQLRMGEVIHRWVYPETDPPMHVVLDALDQSAWGPAGVAQLMIGAVVIAPLLEELFFRGVLLHTCWQVSGSRWLAIIVSGCLFGLVHVSQAQDVIPLATMGILLGYVRVRTGALWPCILAHALFNLRTMTLAILAPELLESA